MTLVIKNSESGWLIYKIRQSTRTLLRIAPLKTHADATLFVVFGMLLCNEVKRIHTVWNVCAIAIPFHLRNDK
jgi:hypothetical protein